MPCVSSVNNNTPEEPPRSRNKKMEIAAVITNARQARGTQIGGAFRTAQ